jgi:putative hydrolase of the HAD superfamily
MTTEMRRPVVFFDMGGTIETFWHNRELRLQATSEMCRLLEQAGIRLNLTAEELYTAVIQGLDRYRRWSKHFLIELPPRRVWREYILADYPVARHQIDAIAEELSFFMEMRYYQREMRPEMPTILEAVHKLGLKMGIISNVQSRDLVPASLKRYGIYHYFDPIVLSSVYGRRKPDPSIFHCAAQLAGVPSSMCMHVGDRISGDILGARRAGYRLAIQIRHRFQADSEDPDEGPPPDVVLNDMTELPGILEKELHHPAAGCNLAKPGRSFSTDHAIL